MFRTHVYAGNKISQTVNLKQQAITYDLLKRVEISLKKKIMFKRFWFVLIDYIELYNWPLTPFYSVTTQSMKMFIYFSTYTIKNVCIEQVMGNVLNQCSTAKYCTQWLLKGPVESSHTVIPHYIPELDHVYDLYIIEAFFWSLKL